MHVDPESILIIIMYVPGNQRLHSDKINVYIIIHVFLLIDYIHWIYYNNYSYNNKIINFLQLDDYLGRITVCISMISSSCKCAFHTPDRWCLKSQTNLDMGLEVFRCSFYT